MDALLLRSLPVPDPQSLVVLKWHMKNLDDQGPVGGRSVMHGMDGSTYDVPGLGLTGGIFPFPAFELLQKNSSPFSSLFAHYPARNLNVISKEQAEIDRGEYVSGEFFHGIGIPPAAGRLITLLDDPLEAPAVAGVRFAVMQTSVRGSSHCPGPNIPVQHCP